MATFRPAGRCGRQLDRGLFGPGSVNWGAYGGAWETPVIYWVEMSEQLPNRVEQKALLRTDTLRYSLFLTIIIPEIVGAAAFSVYNYRTGWHAAGFAGAFLIIILLLVFAYARDKSKRTHAYLLGTVASVCYLLYLFARGGEGGSLALWMLVVPVSTYFLLGHRVANWVIGFACLGMAGVVVGQYWLDITDFEYPWIFLIRFFACFFMLGILGYVFERVRYALWSRTVEQVRELVALNETVTRLSVTDSLTGCMNRRHFDSQLKQELRKFDRHGRSLSLIICDIDNFKEINDRFGHQVGDHVITSFAKVLQQNVRQDIDIVARYGGEEFVLVLPNTELEGAHVLAERIRTQIETMMVEDVEDPIAVTASFGVAEHASREQSGDQFVRLADRQLYRAKSQGRNQVCSPAAE